MQIPSVSQIPKAVLYLVLLGILVLIATRVLTAAAGKAENAIS